MRIKTVRLDDNTRSTLLRSTINGNRLKLPEQLEREDYQRVAKAIEAAGGKWNRKEQCHIFPHDVRETLNIGTDTVKVINVQQTEQAFYTPTAIANEVCRLAELTCGDTVLEPSAGPQVYFDEHDEGGASDGNQVHVQFNESDCGGVFDGNQVISDADPGL